MGGGEATTVSVNVGAGRVCLDASERPPSGYPSDSQSWTAGSEPTVATPCYLNKAAQLCLCLFWNAIRARAREVLGRSGYKYYDYAINRLRHRPGSPRHWPRSDSGRCRAAGGTTGREPGAGSLDLMPGPSAECWRIRAHDRGPVSIFASAPCVHHRHRLGTSRHGPRWTRGGEAWRSGCAADRATRAPVDATRITVSYCERSPA